MLLSVAGALVRVRCQDPEVTTALAPFVAPLRLAGTSGPGTGRDRRELVVEVRGAGPWEVLAEAVDRRVVATDVEHAVGAVLDAVNLVALREGPHLSLHAAVLARAGVALALPGPSGLGKTTLTGALLRRGWTYVSDEALVLPWTGGGAVPYPRTLALSPWSAERLDVRGPVIGGEVLVGAGELGGEVIPLDARLPVGAVVLIERPDPPVTRPQVHDVAGDVVLRELLARCFNHYRSPGRALERLADLTSGARTGRLTIGSPEGTAAALDAWWDPS